MADREAFLMLLLRNEAGIRAFIASLIRDPNTRDDVFQEVALALWQQADRYDPRRPFEAWARGIAANKILQRRHQDKRFPIAFPPETILAILDAFDRTQGETPGRLDALRHCLERLPERGRQLLALRYEEGLSVREVAERTSRTLDAAYQALCRVRAALEDCIRRRLAAQGEGT
ncbi:MAG: sigma-70 family RNA polymerase sigma factor [Planctomycetes bacterium]|nr:sigma-70 family RNA polymerase sigma factor [Planctomycetota bacterium]